MMQKITHGAITMFCFVFTLFGLTLKFNFGQNNPAITTRYNITKVNDENITVVYPNPESGVINLHCCDDLKSPITIKALNNKFKIVKSINDLKADGINKFKYVQLSIFDLEKGEYTIVMTDIVGKSITRKIYIDK